MCQEAASLGAALQDENVRLRRRVLDLEARLIQVLAELESGISVIALDVVSLCGLAILAFS